MGRRRQGLRLRRSVSRPISCSTTDFPTRMLRTFEGGALRFDSPAKAGRFFLFTYLLFFLDKGLGRKYSSGSLEARVFPYDHIENRFRAGGIRPSQPFAPQPTSVNRAIALSHGTVNKRIPSPPAHCNFTKTILDDLLGRGFVLKMIKRERASL